MTPHEAMDFLQAVSCLCRKSPAVAPADADLAATRFAECGTVISQLLDRLVDQARTMEVIEAAMEDDLRQWPLLDDDDPGAGL